MRVEDQLKQSMKYLGITGVDMARKLSTFRNDGRKTAPETISRWISGKAPIDAGVMAWIDQSVRIKAYEDAEAMVTFPADKKSLVIGIANIKNSFSVSLLALQISAVATKSYQTLLTHVVCEGDKNHDLIRDQLRSLWIASFGVPESEIYSSMRFEGHLHMHEFSSDVWSRLQKGEDVPELEGVDVDVMITPIDCHDPESVETAKAMLSVDSIKDKVLIVHTCESFGLGFIGVCHDKGLDTQAPYFYPQALLNPSAHEIDLPQDTLTHTVWKESTGKVQAEQLLQHVVRQAGGDVLSMRMAMERIKNEPLSELLSRLVAS
ncbi:hypothetical protein [Cobetia sp. AM6]|uniref:hypothetical protein n=1 Tax=Cobetia sp. AM6 TaxID=2661553 RepID=UPI0012994183|nr:hypothetical protein [Cobetia sp. AM6]BBO57285.1 hypothetical protein CLAM6_25960 [Cobetia sp. AM6]